MAAGDALRQLIQSDQVAMGQAPADFRYFLAFSYEVFDRYGRFLAFINRNQPDANRAGPAAAVLQRAAARRRAGAAVLHLAQHQPVPRGADDRRCGAAAGVGAARSRSPAT